MIKEAFKAVIGVGKNDGHFKITPFRIILFATLVLSLFLGTVASLLLLTNLFLSV
tara:strand:- start:121 stop:285 length:165 start_codon:yes stop_codon:yes gene_type:complete